jgi:hypothetical protein
MSGAAGVDGSYHDLRCISFDAGRTSNVAVPKIFRCVMTRFEFVIRERSVLAARLGMGEEEAHQRQTR